MGQCLVGEFFNFGLEGIDLRHESFNRSYLLAFAGPQNLVKNAHEIGKCTDAFLSARSEEGEEEVRTFCSPPHHPFGGPGVAARATPTTAVAPAS